MGTLDFNDQKILTTAFKDALMQSGLTGGGLGAAGAATAPLPGSMNILGGVKDQLGKEAKALGGTFNSMGSTILATSGRVAQGNARVGETAQVLAGNLQKLGGQGSVLGSSLAAVSGAFGNLGMHLDDNMDMWRELSKSGLSFNNDIIEMKVQASAARMSLQEMSQVVLRNNKFMVGLAGTTVDSAKKFSQLADTFFSEGFAENMRAMGYTTQELNDVLAVNLSAQKIGLATGKITELQAAKSAKDLAENLDAVSKITGKNREELLDEQRKKQADGQLRAAVELAVRKGGEGVRESFQTLSTAAAKGGPTFQKLQEQIFAMGRPSEDMAKAFAMAGGQTQQYMREAAAAAKAGNKAEAERLTNLAAASFAQQTQTKSMLILASQGEQTAIDLNASSMQMTDSLKSIAAANNLDLRKKEDLIKAQQLQTESIKKNQQAGQDPKTATGGQQITRAVNDIEARGRDLTKVLTNQVILPLSNDVGPKVAEVTKAFNGVSVEGAKKAAQFINETVGKPMAGGFGRERAARVAVEQVTAQDIGERSRYGADIEKFVKLLKSEVTGQAAGAKLAEIAEKQGTTVQKLTEDAMKNQGAGIAALTKQMTEGMTKGQQAYAEKVATGQERKLNAVQMATIAKEGEATGGASVLGKGVELIGNLFRSEPGKVEVVKSGNARHTGTIGQTGKLFEPTDFFGAVQKGETVFTPDQLKNFAQGVKQSGMMESIQGLSNKINPNSAASIDVTKIVNGIKTSFSTSGNLGDVVKSGEANIREIQRTGQLNVEDIQKNGVSMINEIVKNSGLAVTDVQKSGMAIFNSIMKGGAANIADLQKTGMSAVKDIKAQNIKNTVIDTQVTKPTGAGGEYTYEEARKEAARLNTISLQKFNQNWDQAMAGSSKAAGQTTAETPTEFTQREPFAAVGSMMSGFFKDGKINLDAFGAGGMPITRQISAKAAEVPSAVKPEPTRSATTSPRSTESATTTAESSSTAPTATSARASGQSDIVTELKALNNKMNQLIQQSAEIGQTQVRATTKNAKNIYAR